MKRKCLSGAAARTGILRIIVIKNIVTEGSKDDYKQIRRITIRSVNINEIQYIIGYETSREYRRRYILDNMDAV